MGLTSSAREESLLQTNPGATSPSALANAGADNSKTTDVLASSASPNGPRQTTSQRCCLSVSKRSKASSSDLANDESRQLAGWTNSELPKAAADNSQTSV